MGDMKRILAVVCAVLAGVALADLKKDAKKNLEWFPKEIREAEPVDVKRFDFAPGVEYGYVYCNKLFGHPGDVHAVRIEIEKAKLRPTIREGAFLPGDDKKGRLMTTSAAAAANKALFGTNGSFFKWTELKPFYGCKVGDKIGPEKCNGGCGFAFKADGSKMKVGRIKKEELADWDGFLFGECVASKGKCSLDWKRPEGFKTKPEAPRTAYGQDAEGKYVWIFVTGGRKCGKKPSMGLSYMDVADLGLWFGCAEVVNMDGGGSTTLVVNQKALKKAKAKKPYSGESHPAEGAGNGYEILNCTSDGKERAVLDQILFLSASK